MSSNSDAHFIKYKTWYSVCGAASKLRSVSKILQSSACCRERLEEEASFIRRHWGVYPYLLNDWLLSRAAAGRTGPAGGQADLCHSSSALPDWLATCGASIVFHTSLLKMSSENMISAYQPIQIFQRNIHVSCTFLNICSCICQTLLSKAKYIVFKICIHDYTSSCISWDSNPWLRCCKHQSYMNTTKWGKMN